MTSTKAIRIGARNIGPGQPVFVIAEAGSNHDGSLDQAKALIDVAHDAGCDAVKFQIFTADSLVQKSSPGHPILSALEFPREWMGELISYCDDRGILFCATPFDSEAVELLHRSGVSFYKWASPEIHDLPLLSQAAAKNLPILLSTGMATVADIQLAIDCIHGAGSGEIVLLHCASLYPTPPEHLHLRMLLGMRDCFGLAVGLSDHTQSTVIPAAAVALGACVIEKHFSVDPSLPGPDHGFAVGPQQLKDMVRGIREVEQALGDREKAPVEGGLVGLNEKSLVSARAIRSGEAITREMLVVKRARNGIRPALMETVIGRTATTDIAEDTVLTWEAL